MDAFLVVSFSLCIVCDTKVSCHFFAVFVKMKDSRCAEEFVSASPILMGRIRTLDVLGSFGQKMSAIFFRTIWAQAMLQNENKITAFTFVASSLYSYQNQYQCPRALKRHRQLQRHRTVDTFDTFVDIST